MVQKLPSQEGSHGLLKRTTPSDRGLVELPRLTPHLGFHLIGDEQVVLVSETFDTLLRGRIHCDLMPLLDGGRTVQETVAALAPVDINRTIFSTGGSTAVDTAVRLAHFYQFCRGKPAKRQLIS